MTKKYFYDCPIKALYMNKEFGVKFYTTFKNDFFEKKLSFHLNFRDIYNALIQLLGACNASSSDYKIYVAPESEHIFEPKEGDIGIERNLHSIETCNFGGKYWAYENQELQTNPHQQRVETIYRNGIHFFNPKEEN